MICPALPQTFVLRRRGRASRAGYRRNMTSSIDSSTWQALIGHRRAGSGRTLASLFGSDPARFTRLRLGWDEWRADWSKQRVTPETMALLLAHAHERNLPAWIEALFSGEIINLSESRPALHTALRQATD